MGWIANPLFVGSNPTQHSKYKRRWEVRIAEIITRLEKIELESDGEVNAMCTKLIDDLIEFELIVDKEIHKIPENLKTDDWLEMLLAEGIKSGSVGEA